MKILNPLTFARKHFRWALTLVILLTSAGTYAQTETTDNTAMLMLAVGLVAVVSILVLLVAIYTLQVLKVFVRTEKEKTAKESGVEVKEEPTFWQRFLKVANDRVPIEQEADIMLDHNYDGIRELDNHLPPWWKWLFYVTIIFGVFYVIGYHIMDWFPLQEKEYEIEMAAAATAAQERQAANADAGGFDESQLVYTEDAAILSAGETLYTRNCVPCHGDAGQGGIGPNLTDKYWLHGGDIKSVYTTIKKGVPDKGMISWEQQFSPTQIRDVATYVLSIQGTNPPNPKAPQGKLYQGGEASDTEAAPAEEATATEATTSADTGSSDAGKTVFETTCVACHMADGGGGIGPNLTDKYWKNSNGSLAGIKNTITEGVAGTAMIAWKTSLNEEQIDAVANYVLSLKGTTPANPKAPEGNLIE